MWLEFLKYPNSAELGQCLHVRLDFIIQYMLCFLILRFIHMDVVVKGRGADLECLCIIPSPGCDRGCRQSTQQQQPSARVNRRANHIYQLPLYIYLESFRNQNCQLLTVCVPSKRTISNVQFFKTKTLYRHEFHWNIIKMSLSITTYMTYMTQMKK